MTHESISQTSSWNIPAARPPWAFPSLGKYMKEQAPRPVIGMGTCRSTVQLPAVFLKMRGPYEGQRCR
jgi:hypothetical protein